MLSVSSNEESMKNVSTPIKPTRTTIDETSAIHSIIECEFKAGASQKVSMYVCPMMIDIIDKLLMP